jgi:hypothetical protein
MAPYVLRKEALSYARFKNAIMSLGSGDRLVTRPQDDQDARDGNSGRRRLNGEAEENEITTTTTTATTTAPPTAATRNYSRGGNGYISVESR